MKAFFVKPTKAEYIGFLVIMPLLTIFLNSLIFGSRIWSDYRVVLYSFPIVFIQGFCSWYVHLVFMHWFRVIFPDIRQTLVRLSVLALTHITLTSLTFAMLFYGYDFFHFLNYHLDVSKLKVSLLIAIALTMIATTYWEVEYTSSRWKASVAEKEMLEQLSIQQEFETLKSQVNPHFLFNCFNTLLSLISEDTQRAEAFLNELSKVYRYLLRNNEDSLSTVDNELKFIRSYLNLLKTRHGDSMAYNIEIDKRYEAYLLPSLSLQLLVENAVKHNALSKVKPLMIDIFTVEGNKLVVTNNLQPKTIKAPSNKIGLENIKVKYELLGQQGFQVIEDAKNFTVVLPLIWSNSIDKKYNGFSSQMKEIS